MRGKEGGGFITIGKKCDSAVDSSARRAGIVQCRKEKSHLNDDFNQG